MDDIEVIRQQIDKARQWASIHFNVEDCENKQLVDDNLNFVKPSAFVEFPEPDLMKVQASIMGRKSGVEFTYRLAFVRDKTKWKFQKLKIYGQFIPRHFHRPFPDLGVE